MKKLRSSQHRSSSSPGEKILETMESQQSLWKKNFWQKLLTMPMDIVTTMTTRSMSIIMTMTMGSMSITTTMTTRSMSIITTMTMRSMSIITTMTMKSMNIITTMIMNVAAAVDTIIIMTMRDIIMPMMYLQVGEKRQSILIQKKRSEISSRPWKTDGSYGNVLRAKGMVAGADGEWIYFDMVPGEHEVRTGAPEYTGRICVIGAEIE